MMILLRTVLMIAMLASLTGVPPTAAYADDLLRALRTLEAPLRSAEDLDRLVDAASGARVVLLGEASHGTHEFYVWRDRLSRRLIAEQGFDFIAIEGDWVTLLPLDRYVRHHPQAPASAREALLQVARWPRWVWANTELEALGEWLRVFNHGRPAAQRVGVHGIDLYGIWESLDAVLAFYRRRAPQAEARVRGLYRFLSGFRGDYRGYTEHVRRTGQSARMEVAWVARELEAGYRQAGPNEREVLFETAQHARVVEAGERYLRTLPLRGPQSWNARAAHFGDTLAGLLRHRGPASRGIVWAHNTHVGDARATDMVRTGEVNLGQLARDRYGADAVFVVGFGTATGDVLAARAWEGRREIMPLPQPRADSLEAAMLAGGAGERVLIFDQAAAQTWALRRPVPHRAIGVVFDPQRERRNNYIPSVLPERYDAFIFLPHTRALEPLSVE